MYFTNSGVTKRTRQLFVRLRGIILDDWCHPCSVVGKDTRKISSATALVANMSQRKSDKRTFESPSGVVLRERWAAGKATVF